MTTTAAQVREALRQRAANDRDGLVARIEQTIKVMMEKAIPVGSTWLTHGTPKWLIDEVVATYRKAGFEVTVQNMQDDRDGSGGLQIELRVPDPEKAP